MKGSHMWRFLLAGLITVGGVLLLFIGSFGVPTTALRDLRSAVNRVANGKKNTNVKPSGIASDTTEGPGRA